MSSAAGTSTSRGNQITTVADEEVAPRTLRDNDRRTSIFAAPSGGSSRSTRINHGAARSQTTHNEMRLVSEFKLNRGAGSGFEPGQAEITDHSAALAYASGPETMNPWAFHRRDLIRASRTKLSHELVATASATELRGEGATARADVGTRSKKHPAASRLQDLPT